MWHYPYSEASSINQAVVQGKLRKVERKHFLRIVVTMNLPGGKTVTMVASPSGYLRNDGL